MVVDTGLIAALRLMDQVFPATAQAGSRHFLAELLPLAARLSAGIARQWQLPGRWWPPVGPCRSAQRPGPGAGLGAQLDTALRCARLLMVRAAAVDLAPAPAAAAACWSAAPCAA
jgi:hypothetical protein